MSKHFSFYLWLIKKNVYSFILYLRYCLAPLLLSRNKVTWNLYIGLPTCLRTRFWLLLKFSACLASISLMLRIEFTPARPFFLAGTRWWGLLKTVATLSCIMVLPGSWFTVVFPTKIIYHTNSNFSFWSYLFLLRLKIYPGVLFASLFTPGSFQTKPLLLAGFLMKLFLWNSQSSSLPKLWKL